MFARIGSKWAHLPVSQLQKQESLLYIKPVGKQIEFVAPSPGYACSGARDRPPGLGNQKKGVTPLAETGLASHRAALQSLVAHLATDVSLTELVSLRSSLLAR
jgi:hypothetical protein